MGIGERFKAARTRKRLTQRELTQQSGVGLKTIRKVEQTDHEPTVRTARRLAEVLGIRVEWLLFGVEPVIADEETAE
jgi:transcriptional regulator with XRE-family HTH domain